MKVRPSAPSDLPQDHIGRPIIVRCIPTAPVRRAALTRDAGAECPMVTRARFLFRGVSIMSRKLRCERRRAGQNDEQNRNQFCWRFATHLYASFYHLPVHRLTSRPTDRPTGTQARHWLAPCACLPERSLMDSIAAGAIRNRRISFLRSLVFA